MIYPTWMHLPIQFAAKHGFFSKDVWDRVYIRPTTAWRYKQWQMLTTSKLFSTSARLGQNKHLLVLTENGRSVARNLGWDPVNPPIGDSFVHDELVMELVMKLQNEVTESWITEQELKRDYYNFTSDPVERKRQIKFPDLIIRLSVPEEPVYFAIELERTRKDNERYNDFVNNYKRRPNISSVVVLCQGQRIINAIKSAQIRNAYPQDVRPMVFGIINEVLPFPSRAKLDLNGEVISLGGTVHQLSEKRTSLAYLKSLEDGSLNGSDSRGN